MPRGASAKRHAQAIFQMALEAEELEGWRSDLRRIAQTLTEPQLRRILESPKLHFEDKAGLLKQGLEGIGPLALNLALLLVMRGRLGIAEGIADEYDRLLDAHHGIEHAEVVTAVPLDDEDRERVARSLEARRGKKVVVQGRVDPAIIGGMVARIGDQLLDGSTRTKLEILRRSLIGAER